MQARLAAQAMERSVLRRLQVNRHTATNVEASTDSRTDSSDTSRLRRALGWLLSLLVGTDRIGDHGTSGRMVHRLRWQRQCNNVQNTPHRGFHCFRMQEGLTSPRIRCIRGLRASKNVHRPRSHCRQERGSRFDASQPTQPDVVPLAPAFGDATAAHFQW
jgi:hypothetical protein